MRSVSRHAGGVVVAEDLDNTCRSSTPAVSFRLHGARGRTSEHLEPLGFIRFDLLGLSTLRMISGAIRHILKRHHGIEEPTFEQVRDYYNTNLHPELIDFDNQEVWREVFHKGKWAGIFQMTNGGASGSAKRLNPILWTSQQSRLSSALDHLAPRLTACMLRTRATLAKSITSTQSSSAWRNLRLACLPRAVGYARSQAG